MTKEAYVQAVIKNLRLPRKIKKRIKNDLLSDFTARMDAGETPEAIMADMGAPEKAAAVFNEGFADQLVPRRTTADWVLLTGSILCGAVALWEGVTALLIPALLGHVSFSVPSSSGEVAIIGGADGPTAVFVAGAFNLVGFLIPLVLGTICISLYYWRRKKESSR